MVVQLKRLNSHDRISERLSRIEITPDIVRSISKIDFLPNCFVFRTGRGFLRRSPEARYLPPAIGGRLQKDALLRGPCGGRTLRRDDPFAGAAPHHPGTGAVVRRETSGITFR
jgi:hypothetical protein